MKLLFLLILILPKTLTADILKSCGRYELLGKIQCIELKCDLILNSNSNSETILHIDQPTNLLYTLNTKDVMLNADITSIKNNNIVATIEKNSIRRVLTVPAAKSTKLIKENKCL